MAIRRDTLKSIGAAALICQVLTTCDGPIMTASDKDAIDETRRRVFEAYRAGDLETMMAYFHPDVIQIPAFDKLLVGKEAVRANYAAALALFQIDIRDDLENMAIAQDMASTHGTYEVTLTHKERAIAPMRRHGRYMVVMRRWDQSPTGWSTFRELVQPGPEEAEA